MYLPAYTTLKYGTTFLANKTKVLYFIISRVCLTSQLREALWERGATKASLSAALGS